MLHNVIKNDLSGHPDATLRLPFLTYSIGRLARPATPLKGIGCLSRRLVVVEVKDIFRSPRLSTPPTSINYTVYTTRDDIDTKKM